MKVKQYS